MANADKPAGFKVGYTKHGGPARMSRYYTDGSAAIYVGDVLTESSGRVKAITGASDIPLGVSATFTESTANTTEVYVYDDLQNTVFVAQTDTSQVAGTSVVNTFYDVAVGSATTTSPLSVMEIDASASQKDTLRLIDKVDRADNAWGSYCDCYVEFVVDNIAHARTNTAS